jgi:Tfp pilus assembly protein PilW
MTLIEVVLALAVAGFLLTAATSFVVSVSSIWSDRTQRHFFEDHVDGVTEFLRSALQTAGSSIALAESDSDAAATNSGNTP